MKIIKICLIYLFLIIFKIKFKIIKLYLLLNNENNIYLIFIFCLSIKTIYYNNKYLYKILRLRIK